jgi:hypothetical protein
MYSQIFIRLNSKYLRFVLLQGASRHAGIDVIEKIFRCLEIGINQRKDEWTYIYVNRLNSGGNIT